MAYSYDEWTDFSWETVGVSPAEWTFAGDMYMTPVVAQVGNAKYLRTTITPSNGGGWSMYHGWINTSYISGDLAQAEALVRYRLNNMNDAFVGALVRGSTSPATSYAAVEEFTAAGPSTAFKTYRVAAMSQAQLGSTINDSPYIQANTWNWIRIRANGTNIYSRHWKDGQSEPGTWEISATDSTYYGSSIGIRFAAYMNNMSATTMDFSYFALGANGYAAPYATAVAQFTVQPSAYTGNTVAFTDTSYMSRDTWSWDFGDSGTSTAQHPTHVYTTPGTYTITQTVSGPCGSSSTTRQIVVSQSIQIAGINTISGVSSITF